MRYFNLPEKYALLKGLLLTDGGRSRNTFHYCTSSYALSKDISLLMEELLIKNVIYKQKFKNSTEYYHVVINMEDANRILNADVTQPG